MTNSDVLSAASEIFELEVLKLDLLAAFGMTGVSIAGMVRIDKNHPFHREARPSRRGYFDSTPGY